MTIRRDVRTAAGWVAIIASGLMLSGAYGEIPGEILIGLGAIAGAALAIQRIGDDRWTRRDEVARLDEALRSLIRRIDELANRLDRHMENEERRS